MSDTTTYQYRTEAAYRQALAEAKRQEKASMNELAKAVKITCESGAQLAWDKRDEWQRKANDYRCMIRYQGRRYSFDYWCGTGIRYTPDEKPVDVLESLLSDAQAGEQDFEEFCADFCYDTDSRKAYAAWQACKRTARNLRRVFGDAYEAFLYAERD